MASYIKEILIWADTQMGKLKGLKLLPKKNDHYDELIRRSYAIIKVAHDILAGAEDIEDVYNAKKLIDFAFMDWPSQERFEYAYFVYLSREKFYFRYNMDTLVRLSVLNRQESDILAQMVSDIVRKLENLGVDRVDSFFDYASDNKAEFINFSRSL